MLIRYPIYCGNIYIQIYKDEEGCYVSGLHEPLIPEILFYHAQDVLDKCARSYNLEVVANESLPLRGFLICPVCDKLLTGSASKGYSKYYTYYHCSCGCPFCQKADDRQ
jgi:site-specific DNA recombinase